MESASNSKENTNNIDSDPGHNSPYATDRKKWCKKKEEYNTRSSGGKQPTSKEMKDTEETKWLFHTASTRHRVDTRSYNRTGACSRSVKRNTGYTCGRRSLTGNKGGYRHARDI